MTNLRVLVLMELRDATLKGAFIQQLPVIVRTLKRDGSGTPRFAFGGWPGPQMSDCGLFGHSRILAMQPPAFVDIPNADSVYKLLSEQQHERLIRP